MRKVGSTSTFIVHHTIMNDQGSFDVSYGKNAIGPDVRIHTELRFHLAVLFGVHRFASFSVPISFSRV